MSAFDPKRTFTTTELPLTRVACISPKGNCRTKANRRIISRPHSFSQMESVINITRRAATIGGFSFLAGSQFGASALADFGDEFRIGEGLEDFWLATDAYIFGYPLVTVEMTRRVATNVPKLEGTRGPMGQLIKFR